MTADEIQSTLNIIGQGLTALASKLQMPSSRIFEWAVRENYIKAIDIAIFLILTILGDIFIYKFWKKIFNKNSFGQFEVSVGIFLAIIFGTLSLVMLAFIPEMISRLFNPEYRALLDILDQLKSLKP